RKTARPFEHELCKKQAPLKAAERRRKLKCIGGKRTGSGLRKRNLILVDVAEGDDTRQDRRALFCHLQEEVACKSAGASRRQIERSVRECEGAMRGGKARHELSFHQRVDERRHEWRRDRDGENARSRRRGHPAILRSDSRRLNFPVTRGRRPATPRWRGVPFRLPGSPRAYRHASRFLRGAARRAARPWPPGRTMATSKMPPAARR